jgi:hypothetical protein
MLRKMTALILMVGFVLSCSPRNKLVSISKDAKDKPPLIDYLSWKPGPPGNECLVTVYPGVSEFVQHFSSYSDNMPFPMVVWVSDESKNKKASVEGKDYLICPEPPDLESWAATLRRITAYVGPYRTKTHPGFVEIFWTGGADDAVIRNSMKEWVPPIIFRSRYSADYLAMWHVVSGMDFRYDPAVVARALEYDKSRLLEESDPDLPLHTESPLWPFPLGFVNLVTYKRLAIADFMLRLAAHVGGLGRATPNGWIIEPFQRNEQGVNLIKSCLDHLKGDPSDWADAEILSRIGTLALPELLREFNSKYGDVKGDPIGYERQLILVLSRISSPERDKALLTALKDFVAEKRELGQFNLDMIIEALMLSNYHAAIPTLEQIAKNEKVFRETRTTAKIALYALGRPAPHEDQANVSIAPKAKAILSSEVGLQALKLLRAVLVQSDHYSPGMELLSFEKTEAQITLSGQYAQSSNAIGPPSSWALTIPLLRPDRALVTFGFICGKLCGQGYRAKLKIQNGRWIISKWEKTWVS